MLDSVGDALLFDKAMTNLCFHSNGLGTWLCREAVLIEERNLARANKDFKKSDEIRK